MMKAIIPFRSVPMAATGRGKPRAFWQTIGVVYLMRSAETGLCKVGATCNPIGRLYQLRSYARTHLGQDLRFVHSIATNAIGKLEAEWVSRWQAYQVPGHGREWLILPEAEISAFRSVRIRQWRAYPAIPKEARRLLAADPSKPTGWSKYRKPSQS